MATRIKEEMQASLVGRWVLRGRRGLPAVVAEVGEPFRSDHEIVVPVRYRGGTYGVVSCEGKLELGPWKMYSPREIRPRLPEHVELIRRSRGIPEVIMVTPDSYKLSVVGEWGEVVMFVKRGRDSIVAELAEQLP